MRSLLHQPDRVAIIYLVYNNRDIARSTALLRSIVSRMFGNCRTCVVIVDNASVASSKIRTWNDDGCLLIDGDNELHEFSGWERGYEVACEEFQLADSDLILFANDTFDRQAHLGYLDTLNRELIQNKDVHLSSIGFCDDLPRDARLLELTHRWWLRSNIFMHPKPTVDRLLPLRFPVQDRELFSDDPNAFWTGSRHISENWKAYVICWLFGAYDPRFPEYKLVWHKAQPLTAANKAFFKIKALCMLSEHYMGARLAHWKIPIIDFNLLERTSDRHIGDYSRQFLEIGAIKV